MYGSTPPGSNYGHLLSRLKTEDLCAPSRLLFEVVDKIPRKRLYKFPPKNSLEVSVLLGVTGVVCLREKKLFLNSVQTGFCKPSFMGGNKHRHTQAKLFTVPYFSMRSSGSSACLPLRAAILVYKIPSLACGWVFNQGLAGRVPNYLRFSHNWACDRCENRELKQQRRRRRRLRKRHLKSEVPLH